MIQQLHAKMFLADERGLNETDWLRSWNTFNFGKYQHEHKQPFGELYVLNDDTLDGGRSLNMLVEEQSYIILLPIAGAVAYKDSTGNETLVAAGQIQLLTLDKGSTIQFTNPFKEELVNFLQIWIRQKPGSAIMKHCLSTYDVNKFQNSLIKISPQSLHSATPPFSISIGKFSGRGETIYIPGNKEAGVFLFVIEGAFEANGCLLHARDGLALAAATEIDIEALSSDAIALVIEV